MQLSLSVLEPEKQGFAQTENPIINGPEDIEKFSKKFNFPKQDVGMIALNASGVSFEDTVVDRGRFKVLDPVGVKNRAYFTALTLASNPFSPFRHTGTEILLADQHFADATPVIPDTCTDTYWRNGHGILTINTNSRANCHGCTFCGTYSLDTDESPPLLTLDSLSEKARELSQETTSGDLSEVERVGVVTGCFGNEEKLVEHLSLLRKAFSSFGFNGEVQYIGSQLRSPEHIARLAQEGEFSIYLTLEAFTRRTELMKKLKSSLVLDGAVEIMEVAKAAGAETTYLYIVGLDDLDDMDRGFKLFSKAVTRFPQLQIFQAYTPEQVPVRNPEAARMEYFMNARRLAETAYPDLLPEPFLNFRSLWYENYLGTPLPDTSNTIEAR